MYRCKRLRMQKENTNAGNRTRVSSLEGPHPATGQRLFGPVGATPGVGFEPTSTRHFVSALPVELAPGKTIFQRRELNPGLSDESAISCHLDYVGCCEDSDISKGWSPLVTG
jgi:hypothetical protein